MESSLLQDNTDAINELGAKYDLSTLSVISSTSIQKRVTSSISHLKSPNTGEKPRMVLLYARTTEVGKLITIVEQIKRLLVADGSQWYQYNQLFDSKGEELKKKQKETIEQTVLPQTEKDEDNSEDDFETMQDRFTNAVLPPPSERSIKSMRIFVSTVAIPELKGKENVTVQSNQTSTSQGA